MDILTNVEGRVNSLDVKVNALHEAHNDHEKVHFDNMELTQDKMNELNYQILEIRSLTGFCRMRDSIAAAKRDEQQEILANLYGLSDLKVAKMDAEGPRNIQSRRGSMMK